MISINKTTALMIMFYSAEDRGIENIVDLLEIIYTDEPKELEFTKLFLELIIRSFPLEGTYGKIALELKALAAYDILERFYPNRCPISNDTKAEVQSIIEKLNKECSELEEDLSNAREETVDETEEGTREGESSP